MLNGTPYARFVLSGPFYQICAFMKGAKVMDLLNLFTGAMTSQPTVNTLSEKTGASNAQIKKLLILALPLIIKAMTSNASSQNGC